MRLARLLLVVLATSLSLFAQSAGKIDRLLPQGFIAHGTVTNEAKQADPVQWNDILRTNDAGRMRVVLDDGSMLSLGAHSELRVVKHDPASDQTMIEMLYGKARANVVPIKKSGGSFQIRTPTAVVGVVGTTVDVETVEASATVTKEQIDQLPQPRRNVSDLVNLLPDVMPGGSDDQQPTIADYLTVDTTIVRSLEHIVGVKNIDPRFPKIVFLLPGQYTIVKRGEPPTDPKFGNPPNQQPTIPAELGGVVSGQQMTNCPSYVDPRRFDSLFPEGRRPSYEITGRGTSTGQVFDVHIKNPSGCPLNVLIPGGVVLKPTGYVGRAIKGILLNDGMPPLKDYQEMLAEGGFGEIPPPSLSPSQNPGLFFFLPPDEPEQVFTLRGYCLELHKLVPHPKTKYKFAEDDEQQRLGQNFKIVETANKMFFTGKAQPPNASLDSLVQWSLWAAREGLNDDKHFTEQYVGLIERNYEAQKKKFDKKSKQDAENVAHGFWPYVQTVLQAAK
jgi:hypothetical protein